MTTRAEAYEDNPSLHVVRSFQHVYSRRRFGSFVEFHDLIVNPKTRTMKHTKATKQLRKHSPTYATNQIDTRWITMYVNVCCLSPCF